MSSDLAWWCDCSDIFNEYSSKRGISCARHITTWNGSRVPSRYNSRKNKNEKFKVRETCRSHNICYSTLNAIGFDPQGKSSTHLIMSPPVVAALRPWFRCFLKSFLEFLVTIFRGGTASNCNLNFMKIFAAVWFYLSFSVLTVGELS